jgi:hypothetical protein
MATWETSRGENTRNASGKETQINVTGTAQLMKLTSYGKINEYKHTRNNTVAQYFRTSRFILTSSRLLQKNCK